MAERGDDSEYTADFDLLLPIAENIKLLILVPLVVGVLALGIGFFWPKTYTSQMHLALAEQEVKAVEAMVRSPAVLDVVLSQYPTDLGVTDLARDELSKRIRFSGGNPNPKPGIAIIKIEVDEKSPERAQAVANALVDAWLDTTKPKPATKQELERKLKLTQDALADVTRIITRFTSETPKLVMPNLQYDLAQPTSQLLKMRNDYVDAIASIELTLKGRSRDVVASSPTLPTRSTKPKKGVAAILSTLATGAALLAWVLVRQAWRSAAQDPRAAARQARLRAALGIK